MANLKEIRTRIASVKSTRQITSAMKMVSAAKLKRATGALDRLRPYAEKLTSILQGVNANIDIEENIYAEKRDPYKVLIIPITSNKGLCGAFNAAVIKKTIELAHYTYEDILEDNNLDFLPIGKKAWEYLNNHGYRIIGEENELLDHLSFDDVKPIAKYLMEYFVKKDYDRIELVYNHFKNAAVYILTSETFLPLGQKHREMMESTEKNDNDCFEFDYIFEPSKENILKTIIPESLKIQFYKALLESQAAEHGARMTAMHQATDNATDIVQDLTLQYNKARQAAITKEISEIVSGAEALKNE